MNRRFKSAAPAGTVIPRPSRYIWNEMLLLATGLMPLLIKRRSKQRWTSGDQAELRLHLRRLTNMSPFLVVLALPGSFLILPALVWWIDRRSRQKPSSLGLPPGGE